MCLPFCLDKVFEAEGGGALTRMSLSAPHSRKRPLLTFEKFHDTRRGALTRVSTVYGVSVTEAALTTLSTHYISIKA